MSVRLVALVVLVGAAALPAAGCVDGQRIEQLRRDSIAVEGDIFLWANGVTRLQRDSVAQSRGDTAMLNSTIRALASGRARLKEATDRRKQVIHDLSTMRP